MRPIVDPDLLYPRHAAFAPRTDLFQTRYLGYSALQLDSLSGWLIGMFGERPTVRHEACAGDEVLALYRRAGLDVAEETLPYRTADEAFRIAGDLVERGCRLTWSWPPPEGRFGDDAHLVPPSVWRRLNAKQHLDELVPAEHLAARRLVSMAELVTLEPELPVFLKAGGEDATGWGYAVRHCPDRASFDEARRWFAERGDLPGVLVEQALDVERSWCAGIAVVDATVCLGGAEQLFGAPGRQSGSAVDPEQPFPEEGRSLAVRAGEAARARGFRGVGGLDIGRCRDGRLVVFDPNFRINSSTTQLLLHPPAAARAGLPASRSVQLAPPGSFAALADRLARAIDAGWFVPARVLNGEKHPLSGGRHMVSGFVLGEDRDRAEAAARSLERLVDP